MYPWILICLFAWVYGISTFVGNLMLNPFLYKQTVLFQTIQFSIIKQFNSQNHFYFKLFILVKKFYFKQFHLVWIYFLSTHS